MEELKKTDKETSFCPKCNNKSAYYIPGGYVCGECDWELTDEQIEENLKGISPS